MTWKGSPMLAALVVPLLVIAALLVVAAVHEGDDSASNDSASNDSTSNVSTSGPALEVTGAWVRATVPGPREVLPGMVTGAFMVIHNPGGSADHLIAASVDPELTDTVEIHETTLDANDVMQMRPVASLEIPAGGSAELKPGGYHIMLINLKRNLMPGDVVPLTLTFESGAVLTVEAEVRAMDAMGADTGADSGDGSAGMSE